MITRASVRASRSIVTDGSRFWSRPAVCEPGDALGLVGGDDERPLARECGELTVEQDAAGLVQASLRGGGTKERAESERTRG